MNSNFFKFLCSQIDRHKAPARVAQDDCATLWRLDMKAKKERPVRTGVCSMTITINGFEYTVRPHSWNGACKVFVLTKQFEHSA